MRLLRLLSVSILALSMGLIGADAQSLRRDNGPAETPPASFKGNQYVDSQGCVYIRAGYAGQVNWVPRVSRSRKVLCGQRPSLAPQTASKSATATRTAASAKVVKRKANVAPAEPKAQTRVVRKVVRQKPQAQPVAPARAQVDPKRGTAQPRVLYRCGASEFSSRFINEGARCGPQQGTPRSIIREEVSPQSNNQLLGPKGANRRIAEARLPVAKGYKRVWEDGRLNPLRGVGTTSGKAQMQLVWSNTVPRYLIDPATGKRATAK